MVTLGSDPPRTRQVSEVRLPRMKRHKLKVLTQLNQEQGSIIHRQEDVLADQDIVQHGHALPLSLIQ